MKSMGITVTVLSVLISAGFAGVAGASDAPMLIPQPKQLVWQSQAPVAINPGACALVLGKSADPVEQYAAEFLQARVEKRFGVKWPIITEGDQAGQKLSILIGGRQTHAQIDQICDRQKIELSEVSPGFDGYVIEALEMNKQTCVLVGGCNSRGTLYGTDTLFQLLQKDGDKLVLRRASIRDYPTVPWRGRPQTDVSQHLPSGIMDCYAVSRINFIDLRKGIYAYEPGYHFTDKDRTQIAAAIKEARRRSIVVLGAVNCGVSRRQHDDVIKTFSDFISFGVDGLWLSFDDKGPGESPEVLTFAVLGLAKEHGLCPDYIAITPPKGSYQTVQAPFNERIMKVPGMERAWWFWTVIPSEEADAQAKAIGLQVTPSWWHNWPRPKSGLTHVGEGSHLQQGRSYLPIPSMAAGWHQPDYQELARGGKYLHAIMPWGGNAWLQYYVNPVIGWWGWDAEKHDWDATRARVYDIVFGRAQVDAVAQFDDLLTHIKSFFVYNEGRSEPEGFRPAHLKNPQDRQTVIAALDKLDVLLTKIEENAAKQTMIDGEALQTQALDAMRAEVRTGNIAVRLEFPEYWWDDHQRALLNAIYDGQSDLAEQLIAKGRARILDEITLIGKQLDCFKQIRGYVTKWTKLADRNLADWQKTIGDRKIDLSRRAWQCAYYTTPFSELLKGIEEPPLGRGYGAGQRGMRLIATALPAEREQYRGQWIGGVLNISNKPVAAFATDIRDSCVAGDYAELPVTLPISGPRDRLGLMVFMNASTKDSFGLELVPERWAGYATAQLIWNEQVLWEADPGLARTGHAWDVVRLPVLPEEVRELRLRLRIMDRKDSSFMRSFVAVGPVNLVELPD